MQARSAEERVARLRRLYREARCTRCLLHQGRTKVVFGAGNADADLMFVGEAPGQQEDLQGLPFVGRAGKLLDQLLSEVGLERADVFITNVLKSRPPGNRDPEPVIDACKPYLHNAGGADRAARDLHAGQLRDEAVDPLSAASPASTAACRCTSLAGGAVRVFPIYHLEARCAARRCSRSCARTSARLPGSRNRRRSRIGAAPVAAAEPAPEPPQTNLFD